MVHRHASGQSAPRLFRNVYVYAGTDPVIGKPWRLKQTCPDEATAAAALGRLLAQADGDHFPNREATLGHALGKYFDALAAERRTAPVGGPVGGVGGAGVADQV